MTISNYNELFELFDQITSSNFDRSLFDYKDETDNFRNIVKSFDRAIANYPLMQTMRSHSGLFASVSLGYTSLINCSDKKLARRYQLSFMKVFPVISSYVREPLSYFVYNIYFHEVNIKHDLFVNDVNLSGFYKNKFFIVHNFEEYNYCIPFITLLSPSVMFKGDPLSFDYIED